MAKAGGKKKLFRKKEKKNVPNGIVHIAASFNNTMISITDLEGNLIAQSSAGARGFRSEALSQEKKEERSERYRPHRGVVQQHDDFDHRFGRQPDRTIVGGRARFPI